MTNTLPKDLFLFEASWEVCNKVGGIHTVLTTKLARAQAIFADRYIAIGPWQNQNPTFHEDALPENFKKAAKKMGQQGIGIHYGHWLTDGQPATLLIDWQGFVPQVNSLKGTLWEEFKLDSLHTDFYDVDQPLLWSTAVGMVVKALAEEWGQPVLFHGHEWLAAGAFLTLHTCKSVKSVFTTHATVLGRALSSEGTDIYSRLNEINPDDAAAQHGVTTKHQLEKLAATTATMFTTVSSLTGREATAFLGRKPDVITENGVDPLLFPSFDVLCDLHTEMREELHDFVSSYFFPSYQFDLRKTSYVFTMGRYETHNKGYDVLLESLAALNAKLKEKRNTETVVACFFVPGDAMGVRSEVPFQQTAHRHISNLLQNYTSLQQRELYLDLWANPDCTNSLSILPPHVLDQIKQLVLRLPHYDSVPLSPYQLRHPEQDAILSIAQHLGLNNTEDDRVKVLFFPAYFDGFDGIFNKSLYDIISGCDLGIFPSLYEPWGYTPMESLAMGIPAVTSNLAGFGLAVAEHADNKGIYVLERESHTDEETKDLLTQQLQDFLKRSDRDRLLKRMEAYQAVQAFSWDILYSKYLTTYTQAIRVA